MNSMIELTGIESLDKLIYDYKGGMELFTDTNFLNSSLFYLNYVNSDNLEKLSSIPNLKWQTFHKLDNGNTIYLNPHNSYNRIFISVIFYSISLILPLFLMINQEYPWEINIYIYLIFFILFLINLIYNLFFCKKVVIISFHEDGIFLYKGTLIQSIKTLKPKSFSYKEIFLKISKQEFLWKTHHATGQDVFIVERKGFASILSIEIIKNNEEMIIENYHEESVVCPEGVNREYIRHKIYLKEILSFSFEFIPCDNNDSILEAVRVFPISV